ncbi:MAG: hypothetical protein ABIM62_00475 [candidate division WOR-3 bacterium]
MSKRFLFLLLFLSFCFKNSLIDRVLNDYFPLNTGFKSRFIHLPERETSYVEVIRDTLILGENFKNVFFLYEDDFFLKEGGFIKKYFKEVYYSGENEYVLEERAIPFIPSIFINGDLIVDSLKKNFLIEGDTLFYSRKMKIKIKGPVTFKIEDVEFDNSFKVERYFEIGIKKGMVFIKKIQESYEVYAPEKGLIFYATPYDTFKYIGGR